MCALEKIKDGWAVYMGAVQDGDPETVKILLAKGADANAKNSDSKTVLMLAESAGRTEIVRLLKQAGARE
jgi:ankyrin repeat protein